VRITTVLRKLFTVTEMFVCRATFEERGLVADVRPRWQLARCGQCGLVAPGYDQSRSVLWKHLPIGRMLVWLRYSPRRVECSNCGVRVEAMPWARHRRRFTRDFEEMVAYLTQKMDKTAVQKQMGISWSAVGTIVDSVVAERLDPKRLEGLRCIGVDEFSYRKRHRYLTIVVDHDRERVVWASKGKDSETLAAFFDALGDERCSQLKCITRDMSGAFMKATKARAPNAEIIFDRFHVQRLVSDAVDEVRREIVRTTATDEEAQAVKRSRYALLKNPWNLTASEKHKLSDVQRSNQRLYRAYLLKETLAHLLNYSQEWRARRALKEWLAWAQRSKLKPVVKAARTIRQHLDGILAYVRTRLTNAAVEGTNNRMRMIARRAFGFHGVKPLIAMIFLCCGGITLDPPLPQTHIK
jgi:transposase